MSFTRRVSTSEAGPQDRVGSLVIAIARIGVGLMWLQNVAWKIPPDFGQDRADDLYRFTRYAVDYPVLPPYSWMVEHLVLPGFSVFGWITLVSETLLAVMLILGLGVRVWALVGAAMSSVIAVTVLYAPHEWHWSYYLMVLVHLMLWATSAGRCYGLDGVLASRPLAQWRSWALQGPGDRLAEATRALAATSLLWAPFLLSGPTQFRLLRLSGQGFALLVVAGLVAWLAAPRRQTVVVGVGVVLLAAGVLQVAQVRATPNLLGGGISLAALLVTYGVGFLVLGAARRRG